MSKMGWFGVARVIQGHSTESIRVSISIPW